MIFFHENGRLEFHYSIVSYKFIFLNEAIQFFIAVVGLILNLTLLFRSNLVLKFILLSSSKRCSGFCMMLSWFSVWDPLEACSCRGSCRVGYNASH